MAQRRGRKVKPLLLKTYLTATFRKNKLANLNMNNNNDIMGSCFATPFAIIGTRCIKQMSDKQLVPNNAHTVITNMHTLRVPLDGVKIENIYSRFFKNDLLLKHVHISHVRWGAQERGVEE